jgi:hypothetical protein
MKRAGIIIALVLAVLLLVPFVVSLFFQWSEICCEHQDINIKTGQARYTYYIWFMSVSQRIEETPLSVALQGETVNISGIEAWHRANTFSPGVPHSPHYRFHGALYQAQEVKTLQSLYSLSHSDLYAIAKQILVEWQTDESYFAAGEFITKKHRELSGSRKKP